MDAQNQIKRNLKNNYILIEFLMFVTRTVVLAFAIHENPYLSITKGIQGAWINTIFIDITNIFQFIFIFDVIQRENIFQMLLYIPIIMYAMLIILATILNAEIIEFKTGAVNGRARFLYAYTGILAFEILIHIPVYKKLKAGFMWSNFKKIGADPKMNEAFQRREELNAIKKLTIVFVCSEVLGIYFNKVDMILFKQISLGIIFIVMMPFQNDEYVAHRIVFLILSGIFFVGGIVSLALDIVHFFVNNVTKLESIVDSLFYMFIMFLLFIGGFRDYKMFGSGLKEYYNGITTSSRKKLILEKEHDFE
ncbi:hypothetical protein CWI42_091020 [Ordospora colligata]|uniref:Uncharacterized protein n=1 Tax=Ordospora colligata OC4 TaxID=1354746 RepID=A0A0B2UJL8_9MICR|nr:uncharacterized protein M896_091030 [Ordospora colligata OC4]KHN69175.1 hypothetical protein M896_091030 [Ordospora colligata OC4]TBU14630.1 hypothetical protein CWI41_091020 [Ordospora colligata]TBU14824.1 hypothetical protein CWI40_091030 [Ordospora colligata]TBU18147.1 hypothetical protein CWI42_091020 [Ordospora colligata]